MRRLGVLAITLVGLWALVISPGMLVYTLVGLVAPQTPWPDVLRAGALVNIPFLGTIAIGLALIFWRESLATRLFEDSQVAAPVDASAILQIALVYAGLVTAIGGVSRILQALAVGIGNTEWQLSILRNSVTWTNIVHSSVTIWLPGLGHVLIGLLLILVSRALAQWLIPPTTTA